MVCRYHAPNTTEQRLCINRIIFNIIASDNNYYATTAGHIASIEKDTPHIRIRGTGPEEIIS